MVPDLHRGVQHTDQVRTEISVQFVFFFFGRGVVWGCFGLFLLLVFFFSFVFCLGSLDFKRKLLKAG